MTMTLRDGPLDGAALRAAIACTSVGAARAAERFVPHSAGHVGFGSHQWVRTTAR